MTKRFLSTITGASLLILFFNLISKGLGFFREMAFAQSFGLSKEYELYLVGAGLPIVINTACFYLASNYFIPPYNKILTGENGASKAQSFFNKTWQLFFTASIIITLFLTIFSNSVLSYYVGDVSVVELETAVKVFRIYLITIPFYSVVSVISAYLQAEFDFKAAYFSQIWPNIVVIAAVLFVRNSISIFVIPIGFLAGTIIQTAHLFIHSRHYIRLKPEIGGALFSGVGSILIFTIFSEIAGQLHTIIDRYYYSSVSQGSIAALNYSFLVLTLPLGIITFAFSNAIFPKFAKDYHEQNHKELENDFNSGMEISNLLFLLIAAIFFVGGESILRILFQRGAYTESDTQQTAILLRYYTVGLPFVAATGIISKLLYGMQEYKFVLYLSIVAIIVKAVCIHLTVSLFGAISLAISTSIYFILFFLAGNHRIVKLNNFSNRLHFRKEQFLTILNIVGVTFLIINFTENISSKLLKDSFRIVLITVLYLFNTYFLELRSGKVVFRSIESVTNKLLRR